MQLRRVVRPKEGVTVDEKGQAIFVAALALPEHERTELVQRLLETLSPAADEITDEALALELERRESEVENGTAGLVRWSDLRAEE
jgi:putative addiction module component (TIGR02574 family)